MTATTAPSAAQTALRTPGRAWWRIAVQELRGGLAGFWIYVMCLALGAWAIAAAGAARATFNEGLTVQSRMLLGGDAALNLSQREATDEELAWFRDRSTAMSEAAAVDIMARKGEALRQTDVRGVDAGFPLMGKVDLAPDMPLRAATEQRDGVWGMAASQSLLDALKVKVGDRIDMGGREMEIRALLVREPDRLGPPGQFEPRVIVAIESLREQEQLSPGRLFRVTYRLSLKPEAAVTFETDVDKAWKSAGVRYRSPEDAVDGLRDLLDMLNTFMSVIGIAALVAGGVGVAQATSSFLDTRIESIAALKALGADADTIRAAYAVQFGALAALGAGVGVALGAVTPWLILNFYGDKIPLPSVIGFYPLPLLRAFALGLLAAVMFATPALGRARATPPAALFRRMGAEARTRTPWPERIVSALAAVALVALAAFGSARADVTVGLLVGAGLTALLLIAAALGVKWIARRLSRVARGYARLALANLGGPGSLAPTIAPALGLGLALLTLVAVVQLNLLGQIRDTAPANAPAIIFRQVPGADAEAFDALLKANGVAIDNPDDYRRAPFILGRVISLRGKELTESDVAPEERWVMRGETAMTYLAGKPPEADLRSGKWWPADYSGPALVSVEEGVAKGMALKVGDAIGFRIFGRDIEAHVGSIRKVDWGGFGANMPFVLSPGALAGANPFHTAIVRLPPDKEDALIKAVADRWPGVLAFQLRRTLETAADLFEQVSLVVSAMAGVVTIAGMMVLFGAFAAAARKRRQESALLKVFGASRPAILLLYAVEFALAGLAAAALGAGLGVAAAHPIVINVFEARWRFEWAPVLGVAGWAVFAAAAGGVAVGWATLAHRPARVLRSA